MANILKTFLPFISYMALLLAFPNTASSQVTSFSYNFPNKKYSDVIFQGDALIPSGSPYLLLTKTNATGYPEKLSAGRVVHANPIQFWDPSGVQLSFDTSITFEITAVDSNPGDGLVFFIAPVGTTIPADHTGGNFGVFADSSGRNPSIFAVEFDTYSNSMDPDYRHIGIDIEYLESKNTTRVDDAILGQVEATIKYDDATKLISVTVYGDDDKVYEVSYVFDLSTILNQQVQVGLAASTGGRVATHEVVYWSFESVLDIEVPEDPEEPYGVFKSGLAVC